MDALIKQLSTSVELGALPIHVGKGIQPLDKSQRTILSERNRYLPCTQCLWTPTQRAIYAEQHAPHARQLHGSLIAGFRYFGGRGYPFPLHEKLPHKQDSWMFKFRSGIRQKRLCEHGECGIPNNTMQEIHLRGNSVNRRLCLSP